MRPSRARRAALLSAVGCLALASCGTGTGAALTPSPAVSRTTPRATTNATATPSERPTVTPKPQPSKNTPSQSVPTKDTPSPTTSCADLVAKLSLADRVGQLLMVGINSGGATAAERDILNRTRTGSVILLGNSTAGAARIRNVVADVRAATKHPHKIKTLLAADQEGGLVQRLKGPGFVTIPAAVDQVDLSDRQLRRSAERWGEQLAAAGIDADLAPVADVVPADLLEVNEPIGLLRRGYGSSPKVVGAKVAAFTEGMDAAGIATATKHFPGLGRVRGNTDFASRVVDRTTVRHDPALAGFQSAVDAGVDMVMLSSAYYSKIDPDHRAAFSSKIISKMVRKDLGFAGVVISDDLAAAAMRDLSPGERALRFVRAGGDLLIVGDARLATAMTTALKAEAEADPDFAEQVTRSATRVVTLKAKRGLAPC